MSEEVIPISDADLRKLRSIVYHECTDANWEAVKDNWRKPDALAWLQEQAVKIKNATRNSNDQ